MRRKTSEKQHPLSTVRIIGGRWRGRKLQVLNEEGLRPTGDRVKETLFNWLAPWITGATVLDMFSGSGALGFEALSRGAKKAVMCELNLRAFKKLQDNSALLEANAELFNGDCIDFLKEDAEQYGFDLVFLDPPFSENLWSKCLTEIVPKIRSGALVYIETPKQNILDCPEDLELIKSKQAGQLRFELYQKR